MTCRGSSDQNMTSGGTYGKTTEEPAEKVAKKAASKEPGTELWSWWVKRCGMHHRATWRKPGYAPTSEKVKGRAYSEVAERGHIDYTWAVPLPRKGDANSDAHSECSWRAARMIDGREETSCYRVEDSSCCRSGPGMPCCGYCWLRCCSYCCSRCPWYRCLPED